MSGYVWTPDDRFDSLYLGDPSQSEVLLSLRGQPMSDMWEPLPVLVYPESESGDFPFLRRK